MNKTNMAQQNKTDSFIPMTHGILQRQCACGQHTPAGGECKQCKTKRLGLQRKLTIGASNDPLEQEADRVADQVMANSTATGTTSVIPRIQRFSGQTGEGVGEAPASVERVLSGSGRPLEPGLRHDMEARFGYDFSQVRIHTGSDAERSARDVNALAYTVSRDVVFGQEQFAPSTQVGYRLLAHELTHVIQQGGRLESSDFQGKQSINTSSDAAEHEVDSVANAVVNSPTASRASQASVSIAAPSLQRTCSDGRCEDCSGGLKTLWVTVFFRRRATTETMRVLREKINEGKRILRNCCVNLLFDFNWRLLSGARDFDPGVARPAGSASGAWDYPDDAETLGEGNTFAGARGIPMLVVDNVPRTGGGVTVSHAFDTDYTGASYIVLPIDSGRTRSIAHELGHVAGVLSHTSTGVMDSSGQTTVTDDYCNRIRGLAH